MRTEQFRSGQKILKPRDLHQLQPLQPQRTRLFMLWLGYGKPWMNQLTRECDSTLYIVIYPTM